jgi:hypothetical protein
LPDGEAGGLAGFGPGNNPQAGSLKAGIGPETVALGRKELLPWLRTRSSITVNLYCRRERGQAFSLAEASKSQA